MDVIIPADDNWNRHQYYLYHINDAIGLRDYNSNGKAIIATNVDPTSIRNYWMDYESLDVIHVPHMIHDVPIIIAIDKVNWLINVVVVITTINWAVMDEYYSY